MCIRDRPYVAYGILRTADAISPIAASTVWTSLVAFTVVYLSVFSIGVYYIRKLIRNGPKGAAVEPPTHGHGLPNRPLSTAQNPTREARSGGSAI